MKKFLTTICVIALALICVFTLPAQADAATVESGTCGENITWTLDDAGTLTITGTGEMWGGSWDSTAVRTVIIGDGITNIPNYTFYYCENITSVTLGNAVQEIGQYAFEGCTGLTSIVIPDSTLRIDAFAFRNCSSLSSVVLGKNLEYLGSYVFEYASFKEIELPKSLVFIGEGAFSGNKKLKSISIPDSVKDLGAYIFSSCSSLVDVELPDNITEIPQGMFASCDSITELKIPESVTFIANCAFTNCLNLQEISLGDNVAQIDVGAFQWCSNLKRIILPNSLTSIAEYAFNACDALETVFFNGTAEQWAQVAIVNEENYALTNAKLYLAAPENITSLTVKQLPKVDYFVGEDLDLTGITMEAQCSDGNTVELIDLHVDSVSQVDMSAAGTKTITVNIGSLKTSFDIGVHKGGPVTLDPSLYPSAEFDGNTIVDEQIVHYNGARELVLTFSDDSYLDSWSYNIRVEDMYGNTTYFGKDAIAGRTITVPGHTVKVGFDKAGCAGKFAFSSIVANVVEHNVADHYCTTCGIIDPANYVASGSCGSDMRWELGLDGTMTISGMGDMEDYTIDENWYPTSPWYPYNALIKKIVIENGISSVGDYAFHGLSTLKTLNLPESIIAIGDNALENLGNLTEINYAGTHNQLENIQLGENNWVLFNGWTVCALPADIDRLSFNTYPNKTSYIVGDTLSLEGTSIYVYYGDDQCTTIGLSQIEEISEVDMSTPGKKFVTLGVGGKELTFAVYVHEGKAETLDKATYPESKHNYDAYTDETVTFSHEGASELVLTFSKDCELESGCDFIEILDKDQNCIKTFDGKFGGEIVTIPSDTFSIRFYSDDSVSAYGYSFESIVAKSYNHNMQYGHCTVCGHYNPDDFTASGQCGEFIYWTLDDDGELQIFGSGEMWSWPEWRSYNENIRTVVIEDGISSIGYAAFNGSALKTISIPASVTTIEDEAFSWCENLTQFTIPDTVTKIGNNLFMGCTNLETATIGSGVQAISNNIFSNCEKLTNVTIKDGTSAIGDYAFNGCLALKAVAIPNSVKTIGEWAFGNCVALATLDLGEGVTTISPNAFYNCRSLSSLTIPDSVTAIPMEAFRECDGIQTLTIGEGVTTIGERAFYNCNSLKNITFGSNVTSIGTAAFSICNSLETVSYQGTLEQWNSITIADGNENLINATLVYAAPKDIVSLSVTSLPTKTSYLKDDELSLAGLQLSASCASGNTATLTHWHVTDYKADLSTPGMQTVTVYVGEVSATFQIGIHDGWSKLAEGPYPESQHPYAVGSNDSQTFTYEGATELILTFSDSSCTENNFDYVIIRDANGAEIARFSGSFGGKTVSVPGNTVSITLTSDESVCEYGYDISSIVARSITHVYEDGFCTVCGAFDPDVYFGMGSYNDVEWVLTKEGVLTISGKGDMTSNPWYIFNENITSVVIENGITSIGASAFDGCVNLKSVTIPSTVTSIGYFAFSNCQSLGNVEIPSSVTSIGDSAFRGCSTITEINIPDSVTQIVYGAFRDCTSLASVELPSTLEAIDSTLFMNCTSLESIELPSSFGEVRWAAFQGCTSLQSIELPSGVMEIAVDAFRDCINLQSVVIPESVILVHRSSFEGCPNLTYTEYDNGLYLGNDYNPHRIFVKTKDDQATTCNLHADTKVIAGSAFSRSMLTQLQIPDGLLMIGNSAFSGCEFLTEVNIPNSVNYLGKSAFSGCARLRSIEIPTSIATINDWTFYACESLQTVTIPGNIRYIKPYAFYCCSSLEEVILKYGVSGIEYDAFSCCYSLKKIVIPVSVEYIGYSAFYDCGALETVLYGGKEGHRDDINDEGDNDLLFGANWYYDCDENSKATVTFKNGDTVISSKEYNIGDTISVPKDPTKASDNTYSYTFAGWDKEITDCTGDVTYNATYNKTKRTYTIIFKDSDGTQLSKKTYNYGAKVSVPAEPAKASTNTYSYTFAGWDKTVSSTCKGNATYTATYKETKRTYTVTFKDADGTQISKKTYNYGAKISVPADPSKASTNTYKYTFTGWDKTVSSTCKGNATYTATYKETKRTYTVTFKNEDGSVITSKSYTYGAKVSMPANPTKASTNTYKYTFAGWDKDVSSTCKGSVTYTAKFNATKRTYTVIFKNEDGTVLSSKSYTYGAAVAIPSKPTQKSTSTYVYTFEGWNKTISKTCKGAATYTATYSAALHTPDVETDNNTSGKPVLEWGKVKGAAKYEIYRASSKTGTYKKIATITKTTYTDKDAKTGKTYYYKVRAVSSKSGIDKSAFSAIDKIACKLKTPSIKVTHKQDDKQNVIKWSKISGAKKYVVQVKIGSGKYKTIATTTKTSYTHKKIEGGKVYTYRVIAKGASTAYDSDYSAVKKITAKCAKPTVTVKLNSSDKPVLKWKEVTGAKKYQVYYATSKNGKYKLLTTTTKETYTHKKASDGKTYYYKVRAVDAKKAVSNFSAVKSIKVK